MKEEMKDEGMQKLNVLSRMDGWLAGWLAGWMDGWMDVVYVQFVMYAM